MALAVCLTLRRSICQLRKRVQPLDDGIHGILWLSSTCGVLRHDLFPEVDKDRPLAEAGWSIAGQECGNMQSFDDKAV